MTNFAIRVKLYIDNINNYIPIYKKLIPICNKSIYNSNLKYYKLANRGIVVKAIP